MPDTPEYRWVSGAISAVARRTGLPLRWNGHIAEELDPDAYGAVEVDGTLTLSDADVLIPIRTIYTTSDPSWADLQRARDAAATVIHEAVHLTSKLGDPEAPDAHPTQDAADEALEEGLAEDWMHGHLDDVMHDIGMDQVQPRIVEVPIEDSYPASRAAVRSLLQRLTALTGRTESSITHQLMSAERTQRWNSIVDLVIGAEQPQLPDVRRAHLANTLRADLAEASQIEASAQLTDKAKAQRGWHIGQQAGGKLELGLSDLQAGSDPSAARLRPGIADGDARQRRVSRIQAELTSLRAVLDGQDGSSAATRPSAGTAALANRRSATHRRRDEQSGRQPS